MARDILLFDLETLPNIVAAWGLYNQNLTHEFIIRESSVVCAAWKWEGEDRVYSASILDDTARFKRDVYDDLAVITAIREQVDKAQVLIYQNGDRFDLPVLKWRSKVNKLPPIAPKRTIDTLKIARKHFHAPSRKLDYLSKKLKLGEKLDTGGMKLWMKIAGDTGDFRGNDDKAKFVRRMLRYCRHDVSLLDALWRQIGDQATGLPPIAMIRGIVGECCPHCGGKHYQRNGKKIKNSMVYQQWACMSCGKYFYSRKSDPDHVKPDMVPA